MSYCPKCHTLQVGLDSACKACQTELRTPLEEDKILLVADKERELLGLCSALSSQDITFELETKKISISSYKSMSGGNIAKVLVPYRCYEQAREIAKTQGFYFAEEVTMKPLDETAKTAYHAEPVHPGTVGSKTDPKAAKQEEVSPGKKKLGRLLLFLSVIAVVAAVVFFSDAIIGFVQGLFNK